MTRDGVSLISLCLGLPGLLTIPSHYARALNSLATLSPFATYVTGALSFFIHSTVLCIRPYTLIPNDYSSQKHSNCYLLNMITTVTIPPTHPNIGSSANMYHEPSGIVNPTPTLPRPYDKKSTSSSLSFLTQSCTTGNHPLPILSHKNMIMKHTRMHVPRALVVFPLFWTSGGPSHGPAQSPSELFSS